MLSLPNLAALLVAASRALDAADAAHRLKMQEAVRKLASYAPLEG